MRISDWSSDVCSSDLSSRAEIVGASLGNDVNLRDFEGRSALLLGKAKDNNAACAIGPFIRLFDQHFSLDDVRSAEIHLRSEERRVGKECVSKCRSRWSPYL